MRERWSFYYPFAYDDGERRHAEIVMRELAREKGFKIITALGQSIGDSFWFWVEYEGARPTLPRYVSVLKWTEPGTP